MKSKTTDHRADFHRWLLENSERDPGADKTLREILDNVQPASDDALIAAEAYDDFRREVEKTERRPSVRRIAGWVQRIAAILAVPLAAALTYTLLADRQPEWKEVYTMTGETRTVVLPDSSVLKLAPQSKLVYPESFGRGERHVFLTGEVYADIAHDRKCPFRISSGDMEVKVLGTRFNINAYIENTECEVALVEGSVQVQAKGRDGAVTLSPGEIAIYDRQTGRLARKTFIPEYYMSVEEQNGCQFVNMRFTDIAASLERRFGVKIFIADDRIAQQRFYASFINGEGVDEILAILNMEARFRISRSGNTILIE